MRPLRRKTPLRDLLTLGESRAVRWDRCDYCGNEIIHLVMCAYDGQPFDSADTARMVCESVRFYSTKFRYRLFGYCLMPDHLHALISPADSGVALGKWLQALKSFTSHAFAKGGGKTPLWQRSAYDHVCRNGETAETVMRYIAENPVRAEYVSDWGDWPWTQVYVEI